MIIHKLEECPQKKQDLQKMVDSLNDDIQLCITCSKYCMFDGVCGVTGEETTTDNYCGDWKNGN